MADAPIRLVPGDYAPWFKAPVISGRADYAFDSVAGRHILMLFYGSASHAPAAEALALVARHRGLFDDIGACFFGVSVDARDASEGRIAQQLPGIRHFLDFQTRVSAQYGAWLGDRRYDPHWLVLDRELRVVGRFELERGEAALTLLAALVAASRDQQAPVATIPWVFEPGLCKELIALFDETGGEPSGFARDEGGKTVIVEDAHFKLRRDRIIPDGPLKNHLTHRVNRVIVPAIARAFQFQATRIERHLVACYEAGAGHFMPHRDNTTLGTAHRRFAVTINLNADEYEGGDLCFPEFGQRTYRAPTGGAIVFSCSLLHEVKPVTAGRRFAFLPFLYDEAARTVRDANADAVAHLEPR
ncbi:2OG-Fe(II) oxygenase [Tsuneonella sp. HG222]